jgi:gamma-butyrobetaine dioxygenase
MSQRTATSSVRLLDAGEVVEIELDGAPFRFHALWLRDNAQDRETRSPGNGQRLITLLDIPRETRIAAAHWDETGLAVRFEPGDKVVAYDRHWLLAHAYDKPAPRAVAWSGAEILRWDAALADQIPVEDYDAVCADEAMRLRWLKAVQRHGFARLRNVPVADGVALEVAALFGYVRETNYGRAFDVRAEVNPNNLAYTNLGLQAHTDNPYRDPVPGLQLLACLRNDVEGGDSIVVDGFKIVERLPPQDVAILARYCARFEYAGTEGVRLRSRKPLIELAPDGELLAVRFNNRSAAAFTDIPYADMAEYYAAYRRMAELTEDPDLAFRFRLAPGELFIVDNLRVLHARAPITSSGARHLQGCYADRDGLLSTIAAIEERRVG